MQTAFIIGRRLYLRPLTPEDCNARYLQWLNDPQVIRYRTKRLFPSTMTDMESFGPRQQQSGALHLALVVIDGNRHIGNILLGPIDWHHRKAEVSLLIGDKDAWGQGYGREAVYLVSRHAFQRGNLHRLFCASPNPAFNRMVESLGWTQEGEQRQAYWLDDHYVAIRQYGLLAGEFATLADFEPCSGRDQTAGETAP